MSKIFGISNLPVSTIATSLEPVQVPKPAHPFAAKPLNAHADAVSKKSLVSAKQYMKAVRQYFNRIIK